MATERTVLLSGPRMKNNIAMEYIWNIHIFILLSQSSCVLSVRRLIWTDNGGGLFHIDGNPIGWVENASIDVTRYTLEGENHFRRLASHNDDVTTLLYSPGPSDVFTLSGETFTKMELRTCSDNISGMAVDWISDNLYWADAALNWVMMTSLRNHSHHRVVMETGFKHISDIAVHPAKSYIFVSDRSLPSIVRADLSGNNRMQIVSGSSGLLRPVSLTLDYTSGRLYWLEDGAVRSTDLNGRDLDTMYDGERALGYVAITMYQTFLFAAFKLSPSVDVYDVTLDTFKTRITVSAPITDVITDLHMDAPERQTPASSPCTLTRCQHMCVGTDRNSQAQCLCTDGYSMDKRTNECINQGPFGSHAYLYATNSQVCAVNVFSLYGVSDDPKCVSFGGKLSGIHIIAHHWASNTLVIAERSRGTIKRYSLKDRNMRTLITGSNATGMAIDWTLPGGALFWVDGDLGIMRMTSLDGTLTKIIRRDALGARDLAVHFKARKLYWVESSQIASCQMDGSDKATLMGVEKGHDPKHIKVDQARSRLVWYNTKDSIIYFMELDTKDREPEVLYNTGTSHVTGIVIFKNFLIWSQNSGNNTLRIWNMETKGSVMPIATIGGHIQDVSVYGESTQIADGFENSCLDDDMACDHFCFNKQHGGYVCGCADMYQLDSDTRSCSLVIDSGSKGLDIIAIAAGAAGGVVVFILIVVVSVCVVKNRKRRRQQEPNFGRTDSQTPISDPKHRPSIDGYIHENNMYVSQQPVYDTIDDDNVVPGSNVNSTYLTTSTIHHQVEYDNVPKPQNTHTDGGIIVEEYMVPRKALAKPNLYV